jgi:myo-inositol-1(or 4)-monophosphatase
MFLAVRGQGATLNEQKIMVNHGANLDGARLAGPKRTLERLAGLEPTVLPQPRVNSLALRLTRVAQGELDAAFASRGSHDWDLAAADLLVHEAGGAMTDLTGRPLRYNQPHTAHNALIAAGGARHGTLIKLMRSHLPEFA